MKNVIFTAENQNVYIQFSGDENAHLYCIAITNHIALEICKALTLSDIELT